MAEASVSIPSPPDPGLASPQRALGILLSLPVLAIVVLAIGIAMGARGEKMTMLLLAVFNAMLAFVPLALDQARRAEDRHVLIAMMSVMFTAYFVVPVFVIYLPGVGAIDPSGMNGANLLPGDVVTGQLMAFLGLSSLLLGYALPVGRGVAGLLPVPRHEWMEYPAVAASCAYAGFGCLLWGLAMLGVLPAVLGRGVTGAFMDATIYGSALFMIIYVRYRTRLSLLCMGGLIVLVSPVNFLTGSKRRFLSPLVMVVLAWIATRRRIRLTWIALGILTLVALYPVSQFYRNVVTEGRTRSTLEMLLNPGVVLGSLADFVSRQDLGSYMLEGAAQTSSRLDAIGRMSVIVRDTGVTSRAPFQNGYTVYLAAIAFVPRILWPGKPAVTIGNMITENYSETAPHVTSNVGPSWIGEWYMNFGTLGIFLGMTAIGVWIRIWHEIFFQRSRTIVASVIGVIAMYKFITSIGGSLLAAVNAPIFAVLPIVVMHFSLRLLGGTYPVERERSGGYEPSGDASSTHESSLA